MISRDNLFLWARHPDNHLSDECSGGKWMVTGPYARLERHLFAVDALIEAHAIYRAKLTLPHAKEHPLAPMPRMLLVYANDATREQTLDLLLARNIVPFAWKYDWETVRDMSPGGSLRLLYEKLAARRKR